MTPRPSNEQGFGDPREGAWLGRLTSIGRELGHLVLPASCVACEEPLPWIDRNASCCGRCWDRLAPITSGRCDSCAIPIESIPPGTSYICGECVYDPWPTEWCRAWGTYSGVLEKLTRAFKFRRHDFFATSLAKLIATAVQEQGDLNFDFVIAVPMHPNKFRERGYNQAELLARAFSASSGIAYSRDLLRKSRDTSHQAALPRAERSSNVRHSFTASEAARGKSVLLVDDVCTTGSTLRACALELKRAGASRVAAVTLARTC